MKRYRTLIRTIPILIASGLLLSACAAYPEPYTTAYGYDDPAYVDPSIDFGWWGAGRAHGWDHGHGFHDGGWHGAHAGRFAHAGGFRGGFAHAGGFHGGGGMHGGGAHRG